MSETMQQMISIIVPVYNVEEYLSECIESILAQTHTCFELILIDDGSTDASAKICKAYARNDSRIRLFQQDNKGASAARNRGVEASVGKWITFVDADDMLRSDAIELLLGIAVRYGVDIACGGLTNDINELSMACCSPAHRSCKVPRGRELLHYSLIGNHSCGKIYASKLFKSTEIRYPVGKRFQEDTATLYRLFEEASAAAITDEALYYYRLREGSVTAVPLAQDIKDLIDTYEEVKRYYAGDCSDSCMVFQATILYEIQRIATISNASDSEKEEALDYARSEYSDAMFRSVLRHLDMPMSKKLLLMKMRLAPFFIRVKHRKSRYSRCK